MDADHIAKRLHPEHTLAKFAAAERSGKMALNKASSGDRLAATFAKNCVKNSELEAFQQTEELKRRYPLLTSVTLDVFRSSSRDLWIDYVKLVDSVPAGSTQEEQREEAA